MRVTREQPELQKGKAEAAAQKKAEGDAARQADAEERVPFSLPLAHELTNSMEMGEDKLECLCCDRYREQRIFHHINLGCCLHAPLHASRFACLLG